MNGVNTSLTRDVTTRAERAAHDDADRQIEHIAAQNEITKSFEHCSS